jgi:hypothetical protein
MKNEAINSKQEVPWGIDLVQKWQQVLRDRVVWFIRRNDS